MKRHKMIRVVFITLSVLAAIILLYGIYEITTEYHRYYFQRDSQDVDIVLDEASGTWIFRMDNEVCFSSYSLGRFSMGLEDFTQYIWFNVPQYSEGVYRVRARGLPMSFTLRSETGNAIFNGIKAESQERFSSTHTFTTSVSYTSLTAEQIVVDIGKENDIYLRQIICAPEVLFVSSGGIVIRNQSRLSLQETTNSTVLIDYAFLSNAKPITMTLINARTNSELFEEILIIYKPDMEDFPRTHLTVDVRGEDLTYFLPTQDSFRISGQAELNSAFVREIELDNIAGTIGYANYEQSLSPAISAFDRRGLKLGDSNSFFSVFTSMQDGGYVINGRTASIIWRDEQIIFTRWQLLSDEVQAAIIAAALGLLGWVIVQVVKVSSRIYQSIPSDPSENQPSSPPIVTVPNGHTILVLSSGIHLAGAIIREPSWFRKKYVLQDTYLLKRDEMWSKGPEFVSVEASKIEYSYINHAA